MMTAVSWLEDLTITIQTVLKSELLPCQYFHSKVKRLVEQREVLMCKKVIMSMFVSIYGQLVRVEIRLEFQKDKS